MRAEPSEATTVDRETAWPALRLQEWRDTRDTLHLWTQIAGKTRLALAPFVNHWWHVPLYVTARGLTTSAMPAGRRLLEVTFDLADHVLVLDLSDGRRRRLPLRAQPTADFYRAYLAALAELEVELHIDPRPSELPDAIPFDQDRQHLAYDPEAVARFFRALASAYRVLSAFRGRFVGKASPVHFFWGSFDLALTFFSGRPAPPRRGADRITREAYSHEVASFGFWPGSGPVPDAAFYAYAAPAPPGFPAEELGPGARWEPALGEFGLEYATVREAADPEVAVTSFLERAYEGAATLGRWDRPALERRAGEGAERSPREGLVGKASGEGQDQTWPALRSSDEGTTMH